MCIGISQEPPQTPRGSYPGDPPRHPGPGAGVCAARRAGGSGKHSVGACADWVWEAQDESTCSVRSVRRPKAE